MSLFLAALAACSGDPDYATRPATEWAAKLRSDTIVERIRAADAFRHAPPRSYPSVRALLVAANDPDSTVRLEVDAALLQLPSRAAASLVRATKDTSTVIRRRAVAALGMLAEPSPKSVPPLVARMSDLDDSVRTLAVLALGRLGPLAYDARDTVTRIASGSGPQRAAALNALPRIDTETHTFFPIYSEALSDTTESVRVAAIANALAGARSPDHEVLTLLSRGLADSSDRVRITALGVLRFMGAAARPLLPRIVELTKSSTRSVRLAADSAVATLGGSDASPRARPSDRSRPR